MSISYFAFYKYPFRIKCGIIVTQTKHHRVTLPEVQCMRAEIFER